MALLAGVILELALGTACHQSAPPPRATPTAVPTPPPVPVVPTPTVSFPPNMGLIGRVPPELARELTAAVPSVPEPVAESASERSRLNAPATPVPAEPAR